MEIYNFLEYKSFEKIVKSTELSLTDTMNYIDEMRKF